VAQVTPDGDSLGVKALRAAAILGIHSGKLSLLSFLDAYPEQRLTIVLPKVLKLVDASVPKPPRDRLGSTPFWQAWVDYQATTNHHKHVQTCIFGDSISAELGDTLAWIIHDVAKEG
jgi:hypothetical protein